MKILRSLIAIALVCIIAFNGFASPAFADTNNKNQAENIADSAITAVVVAAAGGIGGVIGVGAACLAVDALIFPFAPPLALYFATACPTIGGLAGATAGGASAFAGVKAIKSPSFNPVPTPAPSW